MTFDPDTPFFVFDVESIGLHGQAFAVGGGVYISGAAQSEFCFSCPTNEADGDEDDRRWIAENVPVIEVTHRGHLPLVEAFWEKWQEAKNLYSNIQMAGECFWPVESNLLSACVRQNREERKWQGPYPFHEISSIMLAAGMDIMKTYERTPSETPAHNPLTDARLSARLLATALNKLSNV